MYVCIQYLVYVFAHTNTNCASICRARSVLQCQTETGSPQSLFPPTEPAIPVDPWGPGIPLVPCGPTSPRSPFSPRGPVDSAGHA